MSQILINKDTVANGQTVYFDAKGNTTSQASAKVTVARDSSGKYTITTNAYVVDGIKIEKDIVADITGKDILTEYTLCYNSVSNPESTFKVLGDVSLNNGYVEKALSGITVTNGTVNIQTLSPIATDEEYVIANNVKYQGRGTYTFVENGGKVYANQNYNYRYKNKTTSYYSYVYLLEGNTVTDVGQYYSYIYNVKPGINISSLSTPGGIYTTPLTSASEIRTQKFFGGTLYITGAEYPDGLYFQSSSNYSISNIKSGTTVFSADVPLFHYCKPYEGKFEISYEKYNGSNVYIVKQGYYTDLYENYFSNGDVVSHVTSEHTSDWNYYVNEYGYKLQYTGNKPDILTIDGQKYVMSLDKKTITTIGDNPVTYTSTDEYLHFKFNDSGDEPVALDLEYYIVDDYTSFFKVNDAITELKASNLSDIAFYYDNAGNKIEGTPEENEYFFKVEKKSTETPGEYTYEVSTSEILGYSTLDLTDYDGEITINFSEGSYKNIKLSEDAVVNGTLGKYCTILDSDGAVLAKTSGTTGATFITDPYETTNDENETIKKHGFTITSGTYERMIDGTSIDAFGTVTLSDRFQLTGDADLGCKAVYDESTKEISILEVPAETTASFKSINNSTSYIKVKGYNEPSEEVAQDIINVPSGSILSINEAGELTLNSGSFTIDKPTEDGTVRVFDFLVPKSNSITVDSVTFHDSNEPVSVTTTKYKDGKTVSVLNTTSKTCYVYGNSPSNHYVCIGDATYKISGYPYLYYESENLGRLSKSSSSYGVTTKDKLVFGNYTLNSYSYTGDGDGDGVFVSYYNNTKYPFYISDLENGETISIVEKTDSGEITTWYKKTSNGYYRYVGDEPTDETIWRKTVESSPDSNVVYDYGTGPAFDKLTEITSTGFPYDDIYYFDKDGKEVSDKSSSIVATVKVTNSPTPKNPKLTQKREVTLNGKLTNGLIISSDTTITNTSGSTEYSDASGNKFTLTDGYKADMTEAGTITRKSSSSNDKITVISGDIALGAFSNADVSATNTSVCYKVSSGISSNGPTVTTNVGNIQLYKINAADATNGVTVTRSGTVSGLATAGDKVIGSGITATILTGSSPASIGFYSVGIDYLNGKMQLETNGSNGAVSILDSATVKSGSAASVTYDSKLYLNSGTYTSIASGTDISTTSSVISEASSHKFTIQKNSTKATAVYTTSGLTSVLDAKVTMTDGGSVSDGTDSVVAKADATLETGTTAGSMKLTSGEFTSISSGMDISTTTSVTSEVNNHKFTIQKNSTKATAVYTTSGLTSVLDAKVTMTDGGSVSDGTDSVVAKAGATLETGTTAGKMKLTSGGYTSISDSTDISTTTSVTSEVSGHQFTIQKNNTKATAVYSSSGLTSVLDAKVTMTDGGSVSDGTDSVVAKAGATLETGTSAGNIKLTSGEFTSISTKSSIISTISGHRFTIQKNSTKATAAYTSSGLTSVLDAKVTMTDGGSVSDGTDSVVAKAGATLETGTSAGSMKLTSGGFTSISDSTDISTITSVTSEVSGHKFTIEKNSTKATAVYSSSGLTSVHDAKVTMTDGGSVSDGTDSVVAKAGATLETGTTAGNIKLTSGEFTSISTKSSIISTISGHRFTIQKNSTKATAAYTSSGLTSVLDAKVTMTDGGSVSDGTDSVVAKAGATLETGTSAGSMKLTSGGFTSISNSIDISTTSSVTSEVSGHQFTIQKNSTKATAVYTTSGLTSVLDAKVTMTDGGSVSDGTDSVVAKAGATLETGTSAGSMKLTSGGFTSISNSIDISTTSSVTSEVSGHQFTIQKNSTKATAAYNTSSGFTNVLDAKITMTDGGSVSDGTDSVVAKAGATLETGTTAGKMKLTSGEYTSISSGMDISTTTSVTSEVNSHKFTIQKNSTKATAVYTTSGLTSVLDAKVTMTDGGSVSDGTDSVVAKAGATLETGTTAGKMTLTSGGFTSISSGMDISTTSYVTSEMSSHGFTIQKNNTKATAVYSTTGLSNVLDAKVTMTDVGSVSDGTDSVVAKAGATLEIGTTAGKMTLTSGEFTSISNGIDISTITSVSSDVSGHRFTIQKNSTKATAVYSSSGLTSVLDAKVTMTDGGSVSDGTDSIVAKVGATLETGTTAGNMTLTSGEFSSISSDMDISTTSSVISTISGHRFTIQKNSTKATAVYSSDGLTNVLDAKITMTDGGSVSDGTDSVVAKAGATLETGTSAGKMKLTSGEFTSVTTGQSYDVLATDSIEIENVAFTAGTNKTIQGTYSKTSGNVVSAEFTNAGSGDKLTSNASGAKLKFGASDTEYTAISNGTTVEYGTAGNKVTAGSVLLTVNEGIELSGTGTSVCYKVSGGISGSGLTVKTGIGNIKLDTIASADATNGVTVTRSGTVSGLATAGDKVTGSGVTATILADSSSASLGFISGGLDHINGKMKLETDGTNGAVSILDSATVKSRSTASATYDSKLYLNSGTYSAIADSTDISTITSVISDVSGHRFTIQKNSTKATAVYSSDGLTNVLDAKVTITDEGAVSDGTDSVVAKAGATLETGIAAGSMKLTSGGFTSISDSTDISTTTSVTSEIDGHQFTIQKNSTKATAVYTSDGLTNVLDAKVKMMDGGSVSDGTDSVIAEAGATLETGTTAGNMKLTSGEFTSISDSTDISTTSSVISAISGHEFTIQKNSTKATAVYSSNGLTNVLDAKIIMTDGGSVSDGTDSVVAEAGATLETGITAGSMTLTSGEFTSISDSIDISTKSIVTSEVSGHGFTIQKNSTKATAVYSSDGLTNVLDAKITMTDGGYVSDGTNSVVAKADATLETGTTAGNMMLTYGEFSSISDSTYISTKTLVSSEVDGHQFTIQKNKTRATAIYTSDGLINVLDAKIIMTDGGSVSDGTDSVVAKASATLETGTTAGNITLTSGEFTSIAADSIGISTRASVISEVDGHRFTIQKNKSKATAVYTSDGLTNVLDAMVTMTDGGSVSDGTDSVVAKAGATLETGTTAGNIKLTSGEFTSINTTNAVISEISGHRFTIQKNNTKATATYTSDELTNVLDAKVTMTDGGSVSDGTDSVIAKAGATLETGTTAGNMTLTSGEFTSIPDSIGISTTSSVISEVDGHQFTIQKNNTKATAAFTSGELTSVLDAKVTMTDGGSVSDGTDSVIAEAGATLETGTTAGNIKLTSGEFTSINTTNAVISEISGHRFTIQKNSTKATAAFTSGELTSVLDAKVTMTDGGSVSDGTDSVVAKAGATLETGTTAGNIKLTSGEFTSINTTNAVISEISGHRFTIQKNSTKATAAFTSGELTSVLDAKVTMADGGSVSDGMDSVVAKAGATLETGTTAGNMTLTYGEFTSISDSTDISTTSSVTSEVSGHQFTIQKNSTKATAVYSSNGLTSVLDAKVTMTDGGSVSDGTDSVVAKAGATLETGSDAGNMTLTSGEFTSVTAGQSYDVAASNSIKVENVTFTASTNKTIQGTYSKTSENVIAAEFTNVDSGDKMTADASDVKLRFTADGTEYTTKEIGTTVEYGTAGSKLTAGKAELDTGESITVDGHRIITNTGTESIIVSSTGIIDWDNSKTDGVSFTVKESADSQDTLTYTVYGGSLIVTDGTNATAYKSWDNVTAGEGISGGIIDNRSVKVKPTASTEAGTVYYTADGIRVSGTSPHAATITYTGTGTDATVAVAVTSPLSDNSVIDLTGANVTSVTDTNSYGVFAIDGSRFSGTGFTTTVNDSVTEISGSVTAISKDGTYHLHDADSDVTFPVGTPQSGAKIYIKDGSLIEVTEVTNKIATSIKGDGSITGLDSNATVKANSITATAGADGLALKVDGSDGISTVGTNKISFTEAGSFTFTANDSVSDVKGVTATVTGTATIGGAAGSNESVNVIGGGSVKADANGDLAITSGGTYKTTDGASISVDSDGDVTISTDGKNEVIFSKGTGTSVSGSYTGSSTSGNATAVLDNKADGASITATEKGIKLEVGGTEYIASENGTTVQYGTAGNKVTAGSVLLTANEGIELGGADTSVYYKVSGGISNDGPIVKTGIGNIKLDKLASVDATNGVTVTNSGTVSGLATAGDKVTGSGVTATILTGSSSASLGFYAGGLDYLNGKMKFETDGTNDSVSILDIAIIKSESTASATYDSKLYLNSGTYSAIANGTDISTEDSVTSDISNHKFTIEKNYTKATAVYSSNGLTNVLDAKITMTDGGSVSDGTDSVVAKSGATLETGTSAGSMKLTSGEFTSVTAGQSYDVSASDSIKIENVTFTASTEKTVQGTYSKTSGDVVTAEFTNAGAGDKLTATASDVNLKFGADGTEYTAKENGTTVEFGTDGSKLTAGKAELDTGESITVDGHGIITNTGAESIIVSSAGIIDWNNTKTDGVSFTVKESSSSQVVLTYTVYGGNLIVTDGTNVTAYKSWNNVTAGEEISGVTTDNINIIVKPTASTEAGSVYYTADGIHVPGTSPYAVTITYTGTGEDATAAVVVTSPLFENGIIDLTGTDVTSVTDTNSYGVYAIDGSRFSGTGFTTTVNDSATEIGGSVTAISEAGTYHLYDADSDVAFPAGTSQSGAKVYLKDGSLVEVTEATNTNATSIKGDGNITGIDSDATVKANSITATAGADGLALKVDGTDGISTVGTENKISFTESGSFTFTANDSVTDVKGVTATVIGTATIGGAAGSNESVTAIGGGSVKADANGDLSIASGGTYKTADGASISVDSDGDVSISTDGENEVTFSKGTGTSVSGSYTGSSIAGNASAVLDSKADGAGISAAVKGTTLEVGGTEYIARENGTTIEYGTDGNKLTLGKAELDSNESITVDGRGVITNTGVKPIIVSISDNIAWDNTKTDGVSFTVKESSSSQAVLTYTVYEGNLIVTDGTNVMAYKSWDTVTSREVTGSEADPVDIMVKPTASTEEGSVYYTADGIRVPSTFPHVVTVTYTGTGEDATASVAVTSPLSDSCVIDLTGANVTSVTDTNSSGIYAIDGSRFSGTGFITMVNGFITEIGGSVTAFSEDGTYHFHDADSSTCVIFATGTSLSPAKVYLKDGSLVEVTEATNTIATIIKGDGNITGLDSDATVKANSITATAGADGLALKVDGSDGISTVGTENKISFTESGSFTFTANDSVTDVKGVTATVTGTATIGGAAGSNESVTAIGGGSVKADANGDLSIASGGTYKTTDGASITIDSDEDVTISTDGENEVTFSKGTGTSVSGSYTGSSTAGNASAVLDSTADGAGISATEKGITFVVGGNEYTTGDDGAEIRYSDGKVELESGLVELDPGESIEVPGKGTVTNNRNGKIGIDDAGTKYTVKPDGEFNPALATTSEITEPVTLDANGEDSAVSGMPVAININGATIPKTVNVVAPVDSTVPIDLTDSSIKVEDPNGYAIYQVGDANVSGTAFTVENNIVTETGEMMKVSEGSVTTTDANGKFDISSATQSDAIILTGSTKASEAVVITKAGKITVTETGEGTDTRIDNSGNVTGLDGDAIVTGVPEGREVATTGNGKVTINGMSYVLSDNGNGVTYKAASSGISGISGLTEGASLKMEGEFSNRSLTFVDILDESGTPITYTGIVSIDGIEITNGTDGVNVTLDQTGEKFTDEKGITYSIDNSTNPITVAENGPISGLSEGTKLTVLDPEYGTTTMEVRNGILTITKSNGDTFTYKQEDPDVPFTVKKASGEDVSSLTFTVTGYTTDRSEQADTEGFKMGETQETAQAVSTITNGMMVDKNGKSVTDETKATARLSIAESGDAIKYESLDDNKHAIDATTGDAATKEWDITTGNGSDDIRIATSQNSTIDAGDGKNLVDVGGTGDATITTGSGNDTVNANGTGDFVIQSADGRNVLTHNGNGSATIQGGIGKDTITSHSENDVIIGGGGENTFVLTDVKTSVTDFTYGNDKAVVTSKEGVLDVLKIKTHSEGSIEYTGEDSVAGLLDVSTQTFDGFYAVSLVDSTGHNMRNVGWTGVNGGMIDAGSREEKVILIGSDYEMNDTLIGGKNGDTLISGNGSTSMWGGAGNDLIESNAETSNTIFFLQGDGFDTVTGFTAYTENGQTEADTIDLYGQGITDVKLVDEGIKIYHGEDRMLLSGSFDSDSMIKWRSGNDMGVAKIGKHTESNEFSYSEEVTNYFGGSKKDTLSVKDIYDDVNIWVDDSQGVSYDSIEVIDASKAQGNATLAGGSEQNTITGGYGENSLWGGIGSSNDVLNAGSGRNTFFYGLNEGNDVINGTKDDDTINLYNMTLDDVITATIDSNKISIIQTNGQKLTVNGEASMYRLADGSIWSADHNTNKWTKEK